MRNLNVSAVTAAIGLPVKSGSLAHIQLAYREALGETVKAITGYVYDPTKVYVLNGCVNSGSGSNYNISAGSVFFNGEVYLVDAAAFTIAGPNVAVGVITKTFFTAVNADPVQFTDGITRTIHEIFKIVPQAGLSGSGAGDFNSWVQLTLNIPQLNLTGTGIANVTGTYPNKNIDVVIPNRILLMTSFFIGNVGVTGVVIEANGCSLYNVTFGSVGTINYQVHGSLISNTGTSSGQERDSSGNFTIVNGSKSATGFQMVIKLKDPSAGPTNLNFEFSLIATS